MLHFQHLPRFQRPPRTFPCPRGRRIRDIKYAINLLLRTIERRGRIERARMLCRGANYDRRARRRPNKNSLIFLLVTKKPVWCARAFVINGCQLIRRWACFSLRSSAPPQSTFSALLILSLGFFFFFFSPLEYRFTPYEAHINLCELNLVYTLPLVVLLFLFLFFFIPIRRDVCTHTEKIKQRDAPTLKSNM